MNKRHGAFIILLFICLVAYVTPHLTQTNNQLRTHHPANAQETNRIELSAEEQARIKRKQDVMKQLRTAHHLTMDHAQRQSIK